MKNYYDELKDALPAPTKISLPHHTNNKKQRMNILKARIFSLYNIDIFRCRKIAYVLLRQYIYIDRFFGIA
jgi:hypothetical protein